MWRFRQVWRSEHQQALIICNPLSRHAIILIFRQQNYDIYSCGVWEVTYRNTPSLNVPPLNFHDFELSQTGLPLTVPVNDSFAAVIHLIHYIILLSTMLILLRLLELMATLSLPGLGRIRMVRLRSLCEIITLLVIL
jgi:hypothetical protein